MIFGKRTNINDGVKECRETPGAVLMDVREADEFASGHIPGALNIPLSGIAAAHLPEDKAVPIFVYCLSGGRSSQAAGFLKKNGYTNVKNIGGINSYRGEIEK